MRMLLIAFVSVAWGAHPPRYFPAGSFSSKAAVEQLKTEWYSSKLVALQENSLWEVSQQQRSTEIYRFLWLRTFHHPISIRVTVTGRSAGELEAKETNGYGGFPESGRLIRDDKRILSKAEMELFFTKLDRLHLWIPQHGQENRGGTDGAQWVLEAVRGGQYRILDVWGPEGSEPMRALGVAMLGLAHIRIPPEDLY